MAKEARTQVEARSEAGPSDAALVASALRDRQQFAPLYERYADRLYRFARDRTGSPTVADDIVGETMLAALEGLSSFDPARGSFAGWLFTIARRRLADRQRRRERFRRLIQRAGRPNTDTGDDILDDTIRWEDARLVRQLLETLPEQDRELVLLRYSAGLNSTEIGEALGISAGAVRTRLSRARQRLSEQLSAIERGEDIP